MSSINPNNVDGTYPIAGQDNDSQGFRNNFTNIKNNLQFAYDELTDLQSKAVLKSALTGGSINNDMNYAQLISPQLIKAVETVNNLGTKTGSFTISWADGHFQYFTTSGNVTLAFSSWPISAYYTCLRLQITTDTTNRTVTFPAAVSVGLSDIQGASGQVVTLPTAGVYLFELTTLDNGTTITIQDLLRNYDIVTTGSSGAFTSLNVSANVLATGLSVFGNTSHGLAGSVSGQFHTFVGNITQTTSGGAVHINTTGNVLATGLSVFGNASVGLAGAVSGQFHTVVGNITQTTAGGAVYINTTGNVSAAQFVGGLVNVTGNVSASTVIAAQINTTGNVLATGLSVFGNASVGLAGAVSGQFHTFVGNITQTSSGGAVYINTTGNVSAAIVNAGALNSTGLINTTANVLAASVTTGALINNGNIIIADPIGAGSFGSNLTVKGTINYKTQDQANNFSVATTSKSLTLQPGGDQFLLLNITANCAIGYNATIVRGHQTTVHVKNSAGALAYVIVPNNNTTTGNAFIGLADGQVGQFIFTSYGTDAGNIMVTVTR